RGFEVLHAAGDVGIVARTAGIAIAVVVHGPHVVAVARKYVHERVFALARHREVVGRPCGVRGAVHQEQKRKRRLARFGRADALAPEVECNITLFGPVFRAPDRPVARLRRPHGRGLRLCGESRHEPSPDAEACSLEDGAARERVIGRQRAFRHGILRFAARARCRSHSRASRGSACDLIRSPETAKAAGGWAEPHTGTRPTCRRASPRARARVLLVVAGHRLETPARGAVAAWDWTSDVATTIWGVREVAGTSRDGSTDGAETTGS